MNRKSHLDPKLQDILANLDDHPDSSLLDEPTEDTAEHLRTLHQRLTNGRERDLQPGRLAVWKPGLKNRRFPAYGQPVIVVDLLDPPLLDHEDESGSTYYREPLSLVMGLLYENGDFLLYHVDRRRFQPYEDSAGSRR